MTKKIAVIGDVHACIAELTELLDALRAEKLDAIYHLGDLVDRGPDSGAVVALLRKQGITGVMGNHEAKLLDLMKRNKASELANEDKRRSAESISKDSKNWDYLAALPRMHVLDDVMERPVVLVHAGLWPGIPLWQQPYAVMMAQLINPVKLGSVAWLTDEHAKAQGLVPWWDVWDGPESVVFGHTVFREPRIEPQTAGIDTGCVFGGALTALILPEMRWVQVKAHAAYAERENLYRDD